MLALLIGVASELILLYGRAKLFPYVEELNCALNVVAELTKGNPTRQFNPTEPAYEANTRPA